jgi:hypothetical protein
VAAGRVDDDADCAAVVVPLLAGVLELEQLTSAAMVAAPTIAATTFIRPFMTMNVLPPEVLP